MDASSWPRCHDLLAVKRADVSALAPASREWLPLFDDVEYLMDELISEDACTTLRKLAVNGNDLLTLGMKPGPKIGQILDLLLDDVIDEKIPNERDVLLSNAKLLMNEELPPKETNTGGETTPPR